MLANSGIVPNQLLRNIAARGIHAGIRRQTSSCLCSSFRQSRRTSLAIAPAASSVLFISYEVAVGARGKQDLAACDVAQLGANANAVSPGPLWGEADTQAGQASGAVTQPYMDPAQLVLYSEEARITALRARTCLIGRSVKTWGRRLGFAVEVAGTIDVLCSNQIERMENVVYANGGMKMTIL